MPTYKYKRVDGYQGIFADAKNNEDGTVESDHELNSVYLTPIDSTSSTPAQGTNITPPAGSAPASNPALATTNTRPANTNQANGAPTPPTNQEATS